MDNASDQTSPYLRALQYLLILIPVISLVLNAWAWLRYGIDIPVYDDWRQYNTNDMGRLDLAYLFTPHNDTLYSFGLLLDSLAFRFLDGNTVAYQFLSIICVLGGMLALQWKLINICTNNKSIQAIAFSCTLLMLQPDTYWGWQNLAYHQAIPLLCSLAILFLALDENKRPNLSLSAIFLLGFVSGLSYISGAFAILSLCLVFLACYGFTSPKIRAQILKSGLVLILPSILTCAAQLWVIIKVQHGTHRADAPMAYPWESDFWYFMLGKIARSLMLPITHPGLSAIVALLAVTATAIALWICIKRLIKKTTLENEKISITLISLVGIIFAYLLLISAGRTNLRPESVSSFLDVFTYGFYRFHFFWVTLLWPWIACIFVTIIYKQKKSNLLLSFIMLASLLIWVTAMLKTPITNHNSFYKSANKQRADGIACILEKTQQAGPVLCQNVDLSDISQGLENARNNGASFVRNLPYLATPIGSNNPKPLFRMSENPDSIIINNATKIPSSKSSITLKTNNDPNIYIKPANSELLSGCKTLNVSVSMSVTGNSVAQLFYMVPGATGYNEANSATTNIYTSTSPQNINFTLSSANGFKSEFRFDPVIADQIVKINDLEIRCREFIKN